MVVSLSCIIVIVLSFCTHSGQYYASLYSKEQDDNNVITDPVMIKKIEQLATNKQQLAIARGYT